MEAKVVLKIGPVKARFGGAVNLETSGAPDPLLLTGKAAAAALAMPRAARMLPSSKQMENRPDLSAKAEITGKLAQLGSRLIQGTAKKPAACFFQKFAKVVDNIDA
ncbi:SRPBCC domain-containing protein [Ruegeria aquimaris]|uniref:SRPBCC domain-containing protein n=1 Tax=Ruegeria aquimaris TaxID=2984333 RepID=UPI00384C2FF0